MQRKISPNSVYTAPITASFFFTSDKGLHWSRPMRAEADSRDRTKFWNYHREHSHTTDHCRHLAYLLKTMIKRGHLGQYVLRAKSNGRNKETELDVVPMDTKPVIATIMATMSRPKLTHGKQQSMPKNGGHRNLIQFHGQQYSSRRWSHHLLRSHS